MIYFTTSRPGDAPAITVGDAYKTYDAVERLIQGLLWGGPDTRVLEFSMAHLIFEVVVPNPKEGSGRIVYRFTADPTGSGYEIGVILTVAIGFFERNPYLVTDEQKAEALEIVRSLPHNP